METREAAKDPNLFRSDRRPFSGQHLAKPENVVDIIEDFQLWDVHRERMRTKSDYAEVYISMNAWKVSGTASRLAAFVDAMSPTHALYREIGPRQGLLNVQL